MRKLSFINYSTSQLHKDVEQMLTKKIDYSLNGDIELIKKGCFLELRKIYDDILLFEFIITKNANIVIEIISFLNGYNSAVCNQCE